MAEVGQAVERHLGGLQKESRQARLEALAGLRAAVLERPLPPAVLQEVFGQALLRPLTRCLAADPAERCRELALELLRHSLGRSSRPAAALPFVMPVLAQRLCLAQGGGGVGEPCEELRLGLLQLVSLLPQLVDGAALAPYLPELVRVLRSALLDPFPEAKREGCRAAAACAKAMPGGRRGRADLQGMPSSSSSSSSSSREAQPVGVGNQCRHHPLLKGLTWKGMHVRDLSQGAAAALQC